MTRKECLEGASQAVLQDRNKQHGPPEDTFDLIAVFWTAYLKKKLKPGEKIEDYEIGALMGLFKIARIRANPAHADSWMDGAGYCACGCELATQSTEVDIKTKICGACGTYIHPNFMVESSGTYYHIDCLRRIFPEKPLTDEVPF